MFPVERNPDVVACSGWAPVVAAPPKSVHHDDPAPDGSHRAGWPGPEGDINSSCRATSMCRDIVGGCGPSGASEASLFLLGAVAGYDPDPSPRLLLEIDGGKLDFLHKVGIDSPGFGQVAKVPIENRFSVRHSPAGDRETDGTDAFPGGIRVHDVDQDPDVDGAGSERGGVPPDRDIVHHPSVE